MAAEPISVRILSFTLVVQLFGAAIAFPLVLFFLLSGMLYFSSCLFRVVARTARIDKVTAFLGEMFSID